MDIVVFDKPYKVILDDGVHINIPIRFPNGEERHVTVPKSELTGNMAQKQEVVKQYIINYWNVSKDKIYPPEDDTGFKDIVLSIPELDS